MAMGSAVICLVSRRAGAAAEATTAAADEEQEFHDAHQQTTDGARGYLDWPAHACAPVMNTMLYRVRPSWLFRMQLKAAAMRQPCARVHAAMSFLVGATNGE